MDQNLFSIYFLKRITLFSWQGTLLSWHPPLNSGDFFCISAHFKVCGGGGQLKNYLKKRGSHLRVRSDRHAFSSAGCQLRRVFFSAWCQLKSVSCISAYSGSALAYMGCKSHVSHQIWGDSPQIEMGQLEEYHRERVQQAAVLGYDLSGTHFLGGDVS